MADKRLIDANALLREFEKRQEQQTNEYCDCFLNDAQELSTEWWRVEDAIAAAPTIDAVPVVHGRWVFVSKGNFSPGGFEIEEKCSECGRYVYRYEGQPQDNYCHNCGAKLDGGAEG